MTGAPCAASAAALGDRSRPPHATRRPRAAPSGRLRESSRTASPSPAKRALSARPTCPAPNTTCSPSSLTAALPRRRRRRAPRPRPARLPRRTAARSRKPATAVPSSSTPAAMPVVATSAVPDSTATRITGPTVSAHPDGPVARDVDEPVEVQQQRPDRDRDRRQNPVGVPGGDHDDRQDERGDELDHGRERDGSLDPPALRTPRPRRGAGRDPCRIGEARRSRPRRTPRSDNATAPPMTTLPASARTRRTPSGSARPRAAPAATMPRLA